MVSSPVSLVLHIYIVVLSYSSQVNGNVDSEDARSMVVERVYQAFVALTSPM